MHYLKSGRVSCLLMLCEVPLWGQQALHFQLPLRLSLTSENVKLCSPVRRKPSWQLRVLGGSVCSRVGWQSVTPGLIPARQLCRGKRWTDVRRPSTESSLLLTLESTLGKVSCHLAKKPHCPLGLKYSRKSAHVSVEKSLPTPPSFISALKNSSMWLGEVVSRCPQHYSLKMKLLKLAFWLHPLLQALSYNAFSTYFNPHSSFREGSLVSTKYASK